MTYHDERLTRTNDVPNAAPPRVSIGMPVYNGELFIRKAVESVLTQSFGDFELIISDNASTDGTEGICRAYAIADPRIRYYRQPENLGAKNNFSAVLGLAQGDYFSWLAHDDYYERNDHIELLVKSLDLGASLAFPDVDIVTCDKQQNALSIQENVVQMVFGSIRSPSEMRKAIIRSPNFPIYGMYRKAVLTKYVHRLWECADLSCFNEGLFLHYFFISESCVLVSPAKLKCCRHGNNASESVSRPRLALDFARYSCRTLKLYAATARFTGQEKRLLLLSILRVHIPYQLCLILATARWFTRRIARAAFTRV